MFFFFKLGTLYFKSNELFKKKKRKIVPLTYSDLPEVFGLLVNLVIYVCV